jgi:hypothetical protein
MQWSLLVIIGTELSSLNLLTYKLPNITLKVFYRDQCSDRIAISQVISINMLADRRANN